MTRTIDDYAAALPRGPVASSWFAEFGGSLDITDVSTRNDRVLVTMQWAQYIHPIVLALDPDDVMVMGGMVASDEAPLESWADEASWNLVWAAASPLHETRRVPYGTAIEVVERDRADGRFLCQYLLPSQWPHRWAEFASYSPPVRPPAAVEHWRRDGSLVAWHHVRLSHRHQLPVFGHAASRWCAVGTASIDLLELSAELPAPFTLLAVADVALQAAAHGAHTVVCPTQVPDLDIWGFREVDGQMAVDTRFVDIDHERLDAVVAASSGWTPTGSIAEAIAEAGSRTYYAG